MNGTATAYSYDRYGNRVWQTPGPTLPPASNNQLSGFQYDAAGNLMQDAVGNQYQYDAEGKVLSVGNASSESYTYDALDQRVRVSLPGETHEFLFDPFGRRQSGWQLNGTGTGAGNQGRIYWDGGLLASRTQDGSTYFHHTNWLGTERMRTNYLGQEADRQQSVAFGDGFSQTAAGNSAAAQDNDEFTGQEHDFGTGTDHFQFRQYNATEGRWMSPDPYSGSYDLTNPQSLNRYAYVLNNPFSLTDPSGLDCEYVYGADQSDGNGGVIAPITGVNCDINAGGIGAPTAPRPGVSSGTGPQPAQPAPAPNNLPTPTRFRLTIPGTHYCGPGGGGTPTDRVDAACAAHDKCYGNASVSFLNNIGLPKTPKQAAAIQACDASLAGTINNITWPTSNEQGEATLVTTYFNLNSGYNLHPFW